MFKHIGQQLGSYIITDPLGVGGSGMVYLAEHKYLHEKVAIKLLHSYGSLEGREIRDFLNEARTMRLRHPHIISILDFSISNDDIPFLVMEYASGGSLRSQHSRGTRIPINQIVSYTNQIASALQYAHEEGIIHRDIKPENMLLNANNEVLLSDFGIATVSQTQNIERINPAGTAIYMAPEQFRGRAQRASDQYSLAVVVYEWLSGAPPFTEGDFMQLGYQHSHEPPLPLHSSVLTISPHIEQVVLKALAKDPNQRFSSILEFADALARASTNTDTIAYINLHTGESTIKPTSSSAYETVADVTVPIISEESTKQVTQAKIQSIEESALIEQATYAPLQNTIISPRFPEASPSQIERLPTMIPKTGKVLSLGTTKAIWLGHKGSVVYAVAWSPDGRYIASAGADKKVQVWDAAKATRMSFTCQYKDKVHAVAWSKDGTCLASASADGTGQVWNVVTKQKILTYDARAALYTVAWSPDGQNVAWAGASRIVSVWNTKTRNKVCSYRGHTDWVRIISWSPDGKYIASGSNDKTIHIWDASTEQTRTIYDKHTDWVHTLAWSSDSSRIASGSTDKTVHIWKTTTGQKIFVYANHTVSLCGAVLAVAWSPNNKFIASGGEDQTVQIWNAFSGKTSYKYTKHSAPVTSISWSPDNQSIASASYDGDVQLWQATSVTELIGPTIGSY